MTSPSPQTACAICGQLVYGEARYPQKVCQDCAGRATDEGGRALVFSNESMSGGFVATYRDSGEHYPGEHACWIDGIACHANEHYFGGIVVQRIRMPVPRIDLTDARITLPCALAWRAIAEIVRRRHRSHRLRLEQYHPGISIRGALALVLEPGSAGPAGRHDFDLGGPEPGRWRITDDGNRESATGNVAWLLGEKPEHRITWFESHARFPVMPLPLPPGGRFARAFRVIAGSLERLAFDRRPWRTTLAAAGHDGGTFVADWHSAFVPRVNARDSGSLAPDDEMRLSRLVLIHPGEECIFRKDQYDTGIALDLETDRVARMDRSGLTIAGTLTEHYDAAGGSIAATVDRLARFVT